MVVTKMPAPAAAAARTPAAPAAEQGPQSAANAAPIVDRADIRPLDIPAALQILLAEVRAAFESQAVAIGDGTSGVVTSPPQAAQALLQILVGAMPDETASMPAWSALLVRVETALQTGLDRGVDAVTLWRDVPAIVVDAAKDTRALVFTTLGDDPQNPVWLRPEWAGLAPRFERFWRRRRRARRLLTDPDYSSGSLDDDEPRT
ncbi:MAG TPA: hypothetical protein VIY68_05740 [Steroidobacteraceae bacterium]